MDGNFLIYDDNLLMGHVDDPKDFLVPFNRDFKKVIGGGQWHLDRKKWVIYLYGFSKHFGSSPPSAVKRAVGNGFLTGFQKSFRYLYSARVELYDAIEECMEVEINTK